MRETGPSPNTKILAGAQNSGPLKRPGRRPGMDDGLIILQLPRCLAVFDQRAGNRSLQGDGIADARGTVSNGHACDRPIARVAAGTRSVMADARHARNAEFLYESSRQEWDKKRLRSPVSWAGISANSRMRGLSRCKQTTRSPKPAIAKSRSGAEIARLPAGSS
jgi:hypothetical protein